MIHVFTMPKCRSPFLGRALCMKNLSLNDAVDRDIPGSAMTFIAAANPFMKSSYSSARSQPRLWSQIQA
jgi:hypothetical protein